MNEGTTYLRDTVDLVRQIETRFIELGSRLYRIRDKGLWKSTYETYQDFLDAAKIGHSHASILESIHRKYVVEGNVPENNLAGIGYSNLYTAIPLIEREGVWSAVAKADTLSRNEIKDEVRDMEHGEHEHVLKADRWGVCKSCGKFVKINFNEKEAK